MSVRSGVGIGVGVKVKVILVSLSHKNYLNISPINQRIIQ
jgi:hypothetical protein